MYSTNGEHIFSECLLCSFYVSDFNIHLLYISIVTTMSYFRLESLKHFSYVFLFYEILTTSKIFHIKLLMRSAFYLVNKFFLPSTLFDKLRF
jgi:hypothetical protein